MSLQNQQGTTLTLNGEDWHEFDTRKGGEVSYANQPRYKPGQAFPSSSTGLASVSQVVLDREWDPGIDDDLYARYKGAGAVTGTVGFHNRNADKSLVPTPYLTLPVKLAKIGPPEQDIAGNNSGRFTVTLDPNGAPS
jgi:hypothetical protein